jgi:ATP-dependent RNA helicase RhlE
MKFEDLNIIAPILDAIKNEGYTIPTPIQEQSIPVLLEGRDILGSAQTGTGKTAAFAVPILQGIYEDKKYSQGPKQIKALVLAPTRELAEQIKDSFRAYGKALGIRSDVVYGGVNQKSQVVSIKKGLDVLIATPGRLLDLMNQGIVDIRHIRYFVLDEADRMLDMGFIIDVNRIVDKIPKDRQTMLFSATVPKEITKLANSLLKDPVRIEITPPETMLEMIKQSLYHVAKKDKTNLLLDILVDPKVVSVLIFTRTKHGANKLVKELIAYGVKADAIHGNKSQNKRQQALQDFKKGKIRVLVATDIAARGIDIDELSHVINYDLPESPETYIHRMGRTGRAGLSGEAFTFCSAEEGHLLKAIEKHNKMSIPLIQHHQYTTNFTGLILTKPSKTKPQTRKSTQPGKKKGLSKPRMLDEDPNAKVNEKRNSQKKNAFAQSFSDSPSKRSRYNKYGQQKRDKNQSDNDRTGETKTFSGNKRKSKYK